MKATVAALLTFAAAAPLACRTPTEMTERQLAKVTLANLCDAYTQTERRLPDPVQAYEDVRDHYTTLWAPLIKMRAGVEGIDASVRYRLWLHFARHDYGVAGWSCPALDRLLLRILGRVPKPPPRSPDAARYPTVRASSSGDLSIDGEAVQPAALRETLARWYEESHIVDLYREGWATKMSPNADLVMNELVDQRFIFGVCAQPDCPP